jgi:hypothetical protein
MFIETLTDDLWRDIVRLGRARGRARRETDEGTVSLGNIRRSEDVVLLPAIEVVAPPVRVIVGAPGGGYAGNPPGAPPGSCSKSDFCFEIEN